MTAKRRKRHSAASRNQRNLTADFTDFTDEEDLSTQSRQGPGRQAATNTFEQEETEETELYLFRSLFSLCAPVQNCFIMRRYGLATAPPEKRKFLRKSQLWSEDFTAKLFCNVEWWIERLPRLIGLCESTVIAVPISRLDPFIEPLTI
jgi:hypothetical protein